MTVTFEKVDAGCWCSEYHIKDDEYFIGFINKMGKNDPWRVYVRYVFTPTKCNDQFRTLKEAKEKVIEELETIW